MYVIDRGNKVVRRNVKIGDVSDAGDRGAVGPERQRARGLSAGAFLNPGEKVIPELKRTN